MLYDTARIQNHRSRAHMLNHPTLLLLVNRTPARILEWVAISWKWKAKVKSLSRVRLLATPWTAAHQAPPSLGFSRQEHWSGLPFPFPRHESEKWKWSHLVVSDSSRPHGLQPTRLLLPWDFPGKSTGVGCHCLLHLGLLTKCNSKPL